MCNRVSQFCEVFFMSILSERLRELRGPSSQKAMADAVGIKWNAWARYESGTVSPGAEILSTICRVHACSADWLLGLKDHGGSVSVNAGSGAAVAIGTGAKASATAAKKAAPAADCRKCPYKSWGEKFRKAGGIIPGI